MNRCEVRIVPGQRLRCSLEARAREKRWAIFNQVFQYLEGLRDAASTGSRREDLEPAEAYDVVMALP